MKSRLAQIAQTLRYVAIVNFVIFTLLLFYLGGDALNGKEDAGHFYLGQHGKFVEVSSAVFHYSYWHTILTLALIMVTLLLGTLLKSESAKRK